jgi:hypothetical protein
MQTKTKLTNEFVEQVLREAAVEIYGDDGVDFGEEIQTFTGSGDNGDLVAETIGYAVKLAAEKLGYPKPVHYYWQILPWHPDAYSPDEDIAFVIVDDDGKCLTFNRDKFGHVTISEHFPLSSFDDAVEIVRTLVEIIMTKGE